jgi:hypothetical protein
MADGIAGNAMMAPEGRRQPNARLSSTLLGSSVMARRPSPMSLESYSEARAGSEAAA